MDSENKDFDDYELAAKIDEIRQQLKKKYDMQEINAYYEPNNHNIIDALIDIKEEFEKHFPSFDIKTQLIKMATGRFMLCMEDAISIPFVPIVMYRENRCSTRLFDQIIDIERVFPSE